MNNKQRKALEAALDCIERTGPNSAEAANRQAYVIVLLRKALAEPEFDLRGIDASTVSDWVHLRNHGCFPADELLIPLKSIPRYLAQNPTTSPREWQELSEDEIGNFCELNNLEFWRHNKENFGFGSSLVGQISKALRAKNGGAA